MLMQLKTDEGRVTKGSPHNALSLSGATERGGQLKQFKKLVESKFIKGYKNHRSRCIFSFRRRETSQALEGSSHAGPQVPSLEGSASGSCSLSWLDVLGAAREKVKFIPEIWK